MITQAVEYSLRAIVVLARGGDRSSTAQQLSELTEVPAPYLSKLMQTLVRHELVQSRRGVNGGFTLARKPEEMTIFDVVQAVEPLKRIRQCPLGFTQHSGTLCPLHRRLDAIRQLASLDLEREGKMITCPTDASQFDVHVEQEYFLFSIPNVAKGSIRPSELLAHVGLGHLLEAGVTLQRTAVHLQEPVPMPLPT